MPATVISNRYELLEELSHGGMGDVWRGYDAVLDRPVAVKLIRQAAVTSLQSAEELARRFRREARITARIQHPGVPQVFDAVLDDSFERLFLVMELVDGVPLSAYLQPDHPLPVSWAAAVAAQVATVLSHAHDVPVIHRDLKPSNILVARDGTVKVLDFGIAAILRTDVTKLTATGSPIGTHQYMSPEQVRSGRITPQTDLYALGCVLHELLAGRPVFEGNEYALMHQHLTATSAPLRQLRADVPEPLETLVLHLLRKAAESRPADTQEVYERLLPFLPAAGSVPTQAEAGPLGTPDPTRLFRHPYAPRSRAPKPPAVVRTPTAVELQPLPVLEQVRAAIKEAYAQADLLLDDERFTQAVEVIGAVVETAASAFGTDSKEVLGLRKQRAAIRFLGGDYRAALPEFEALAAAFGRTAGTASTAARECRAQAARCRAELGQVTEALHELQDVLATVRALDGDVSEEAIDLRHGIAVLLLAQGKVTEALQLLKPLQEDLIMVYGPEDELALEVAETLARIRLDLNGGAPE
ncbi:protein kinase [Kitasatospora sp. NPDC059803]|uniref:serine/threonine-protein kinase n=1 Tax=Kitasatospora sp. NPDC059803 TaxID=3346953 RepID=UPI00365E7241